MTELIKVNPQKFDIDPDKGKEIFLNFVPVAEEIAELETAFDAVIGLEDGREACEQALKLYKRYRKLTNETAKIHKKEKAFYLNGGKYVDAIKRSVTTFTGDRETKLKYKADFIDRQIREANQKIHDARAAKIEMLGRDPSDYGDLVNITEQVFNSILQGIKFENFEAEKAEKEKAEQEQRLKEEAERLRKEREELEKEKALQVEKLRKEREELEKEKAEMKEQETEYLPKTKPEDRLTYLVNIAIDFLINAVPEMPIEYDGDVFDGASLADDLKEALK